MEGDGDLISLRRIVLIESPPSIPPLLRRKESYSIYRNHDPQVHGESLPIEYGVAHLISGVSFSGHCAILLAGYSVYKCHIGGLIPIDQPGIGPDAFPFPEPRVQPELRFQRVQDITPRHAFSNVPLKSKDVYEVFPDDVLPRFKLPRLDGSRGCSVIQGNPFLNDLTPRSSLASYYQRSCLGRSPCRNC